MGEREYCRFHVHHLKRRVAGEDWREFRVHFYACTRCTFKGLARPLNEALDSPPRMTRLFGRIDDEALSG